MNRSLERHYTTRQVAERLEVNEATVLRAAARGELRSVRFGHRRRYAESALQEWLESLASPSPRGPAA